MGLQTFDQFTYLHFAAGILAYFWGIPFILWVVLHTIFEIIENTESAKQIGREKFKLYRRLGVEPRTFKL